MLKSKIFVGSLVGATAFSAIILSSSTVSAETYTKSALIRVQAACTMDGTVTTAHSATIAGGTYREGIGESIVSITCNDAGGFGVYAIGFTGDTNGNNVLAHGTEDVSIATGTATSGNTSNWAMKLEAYENGNNTPTIENGYDSYKVVPSDYTLVASYPNATSATDDVIFRTYYSAYIAMTQRAGTYTGKVKYVMVHPATGPAPEKECLDFECAFNPNVPKIPSNDPDDPDDPDVYYPIQDIDAICGKVKIPTNNSNVPTIQVVDKRDGKKYWIAKLADGNCWMTQNLDYQLNSSTALVHATSDIGWGSDTTTVSWTPANSTMTNDTDWDKNLYTKNPSSVRDGSKYSVTSGNTQNDTIYNSLSACMAANHTKTECQHYHIGTFYNWAAAIAINEDSYPSNLDDEDAVAQNSICPAGWKLPTGIRDDAKTYAGASDFDRLFYAMGVYQTYHDKSDNWEYLSGDEGFASVRTAPLYLTRGGYIGDYISGQGDTGYYWMNTAGYNYNNTIRAQRLSVLSNVLGPGEQDWRDRGMFIRCVTR